MTGFWDGVLAVLAVLELWGCAFMREARVGVRRAGEGLCRLVGWLVGWLDGWLVGWLHDSQ